MIARERRPLNAMSLDDLRGRAAGYRSRIQRYRDLRAVIGEEMFNRAVWSARDCLELVDAEIERRQGGPMQ